MRREAKAHATTGYQVSVIAPLSSGQSWNDVVEGIRFYRFPTPIGAKSIMGYLREYGHASSDIPPFLCVSSTIYLERKECAPSMDGPNILVSMHPTSTGTTSG